MKGSVYKRGKTWTYQIDLGVDPATGKRNRPSKGGFRTQKEAQLAMAAVMVSTEKGTYTANDKTLFKDFIPSWLEEYSLSVKESSVRVRKHESGHLIKYFGHIHLTKITKASYQNMLIDLTKKEYSLSTISGIHGTARMIFSKALFLGLIKEDPTEHAKIPRRPRKLEDVESHVQKLKYLEKHDLKKFLETAKKYGLEDDYLIFFALSYTGLRVGELCALEWSRVDLSAQTLSVRQTYYNPQNNKKEYTLLPPKTESSVRDLEIDDDLCIELKKHKAKQAEYRLACPEYHDRQFVFTLKGENPGYPYYIKLIENRMTRLLKIAELDESLTPHSLRHTHTSLLAEAGVSLVEIMERLGHKNDEITREIYLHVTKTMKKEASQKFSNFMKDL